MPRNVVNIVMKPKTEMNDMLGAVVLVMLRKNTA